MVTLYLSQPRFSSCGRTSTKAVQPSAWLRSGRPLSDTSAPCAKRTTGAPQRHAGSRDQQRQSRMRAKCASQSRISRTKIRPNQRVVVSRPAVKSSHEPVDHWRTDTGPRNDVDNDKIARAHHLVNSNSSDNPASSWAGASCDPTVAITTLAAA
jgi:hypothetical protein